MTVKNISFYLTYYHHVTYLGNCTKDNTTALFLPPYQPEIYSSIPVFVLLIIGFAFNILSVVIFTRKEPLPPASNQTTSTGATQRILIAQSTTVSNSVARKRSRRTHADKSSVTVSLLILCICECTFTFFQIVSTSLQFYTNTVPPEPSDGDRHRPPRSEFLILPVAYNLAYYIADVGLLGRNWCICLITLARAEVVLFPLGSKAWQRCLRRRRVFLALFLCILSVALLLAYLKHADQYGELCYDMVEQLYGLSGETFLMSNQQYFTFGTTYFLLQTGLVWILVVIFTVIIILGLKPWSHSDESMFSSGNKAGSGKTSSSANTQMDALRKRRQSQLRATRVVLVVVVTFLCFESMTVIMSIVQKTGVLTKADHNELLLVLMTVANTLVAVDTIANFFVFYVTIEKFRQHVKHIYSTCCKKDTTAQEKAPEGVEQPRPPSKAAISVPESEETETIEKCSNEDFDLV